MIQERAVPIRRSFQLVGQIGSCIQVILVQFCVSPDLLRIILMMRSTMEAHAHAAFRIQLFRKRIALPRQVAGPEQCHDSRNVGFEGQRCQIPMQLDVVVKRVRYPRWLLERRNGGRRFRRQLNSPLDLAHFLGVLIDRPLVRRAEILFKTLQFVHQRIQDAPALLHPRGAHFGSGAAAEQTLEHDLRIEFHG